MKRKISIGGGVLVFAVFLFLGGYRYMEAKNVVSWLFAVLTHETGHYIAARFCGVKIEKVTLDVIGARMSLSGKLISYGEEILIASAGPAVNLALSALLFPHLPSLAVLSLVLGLLNLLPAPGFDGYRIICSALSWRFGANVGARIINRLSFFSVLFLWLMSAYALLRYRQGFSLFILSCALFVIFMKK